jgi:NAD(P)H-hydrate epimerase
LRGDAAKAAAACQREVLPLDPALVEGARLVVDGLFGAGLARPVDGVARDTIETVSRAEVPVVAIDIPSGVHGDSGAVLGAAARATLTVTFHRAKPGHFLLPGRDHVGELVVADIGIPEQAMDGPGRLFASHPRLWRALLPRRTSTSHKYAHGHALVLGGGMASSGAARMAARAALRAGAGLVTVVCPKDALAVYAAQLTAVMVAPFADDQEYAQILTDPRRNGMLLGPGAGVGEILRRRVLRVLEAKKACVLDADALTSFQERPQALFDALAGAPCVLTPHDGEYGRLFAHAGDRLTRARAAAAQSGAVLLLKGGDSVVAAADGRAFIQPAAPPDLATAGSGDVLAGIVLGLLVQGMPALEAAAAAVWLHARAGYLVGPGLIAEDLPEALPAVLAELEQMR